MFFKQYRNVTNMPFEVKRRGERRRNVAFFNTKLLPSKSRPEREPR